VLIPNTYIIGDDLSRVPPYKNNDYQDVVFVLTNASPAVAQGPVISGSSLTDNLAAGGTVSAACAVTGFDGVMADTAGDQCNAGNVAFSGGGLTLTSTAGQLANNNQQNALYKTFDATRGAFTVDAQVKGPASYISSDYQQFGAWFGPDQNNFFKVEIDSEGSAPHATLLWREKGVSAPSTTVALPAVSTASTIDLIIKGNYTLPDPVPYGDTYGVHGYPLSELTAYYSINGGTPVQIGTGYYQPGDVTGWFSRMAKAGIVVSNSGSATPISPTFTKFGITAP
jgi:hypothetical protein